MTIASELTNQVSAEIRQRGRNDYQRGLVNIFIGNNDLVEAEVRDSMNYSVRLVRGVNTLRVGCTCPYFQDYGYTCKHIWATILAAESRGYLRPILSSNRVELVEDDEFLGESEPDYEEDEDDYEEWEEYRPPTTSHRSSSRSRSKSRSRERAPTWKQQLAGLRPPTSPHTVPLHNSWPSGREVLYIVNVPQSTTNQGLALEVAYRELKQNGEWSKPKSQRIGTDQIPHLPDPRDRQILSLLAGARDQYGYSYGGGYYHNSATKLRLTELQADSLIPQMCQTGRCLLRVSEEDPDLKTLCWDDAGPYEFVLEVAPDPSGKHYLGAGWLQRGKEKVAVSDRVLLVKGGLLFWDDRVARLQDHGAFDVLSMFRTRGMFKVPVKQGAELVAELLKVPNLPRLELPKDLRFEEVSLPPKPCLKVKAPEGSGYYGYSRLNSVVSFDYDGEVVAWNQPGNGVYQAEKRRLIRRDPAAEEAARAKLMQLGFRKPSYYYADKNSLELAPRLLPKVVRKLLDAGWHVEAEGKVYRSPGEINIKVTSGIDWFDVHGTVEFGDTTASLPALLAALKKGENLVRLDDGTYGTLPEDWLKKYGLLAGLGKVEGDTLRFTKTQVGLLDALLASQPKVTFDKVFENARAELRSFDGIKPADAPEKFTGELRAYQRDGLGWLQFLQKFGFGGCLADDMGLGKTVQVLALLDSRRALRAQAATKKNSDDPGPSLVVVPKSLLFNWKQEAARFTPELRVLEHFGSGRKKPGDHFNEYDVILTTYGTLRRDAVHFKDQDFDYCILDEAQAVKNSRTEAAKAVRLLQGNHRLALSGTPVENHLGELWSLFDYLNPGMLGSASVFKLTGSSARNPDADARALLAKGLRPFILRRTKDQVAKDLPAKTEQTLFCELDTAQRKAYDELRNHYRMTLLNKVETDGINKSKIMVLEALLRLRQAACHVGLIDAKKKGDPSAKFDVLLPQLEEVVEEGHKALVFSQFTSLLSILRERLDKEGIPYEYLDGKTTDRKAKVEHFQNDPDCRLFLISLKAGGLGLNLTAAEYVFLLDPWWNPAVEAQAIDRAHRIGQTKPVFAYRLIAKDTVEEKVLELQKTKRALADAIINADNSLIRNLTADDLRLLLS